MIGTRIGTASAQAAGDRGMPNQLSAAGDVSFLAGELVTQGQGDKLNLCEDGTFTVQSVTVAVGDPGVCEPSSGHLTVLR